MIRTHRFARAAVAGALAFLSACALNTGRPGIAADPDLITREEIEASGQANAYEVVQRLRPAWLRQRVDHRTTGVNLQTLVIHNGSRYGFLGSLRDLPAELIGSMRFLEGSEAQSLLTGTDQDIGAIIQVSSHGVASFGTQRSGKAGGTLPDVSLTIFPLGYAAGQHAGGRGDVVLGNDWEMTRGTPAFSGMALAAVDIGVARSARIGILAGRKLDGDEELYSRPGGDMVIRHTSTVIAATLGYRVGSMRIGAGPAVQLSRVVHRVGECLCQTVLDDAYILRGGVVEGVAQMRVLRALRGELRVQRYFLPERSVSTLLHTDTYDLGRMGWFVGLGGGLGIGP